jgi:hypothetical protein
MTVVATGCLLAGVLVGVAGAQVLFYKPHFLNTGLFTLGPFEGANFRVTLDDEPAAAPAQVELSFYDHAGVVVKKTTTILDPAESVSLQLVKVGVFRAHARVLEPDTRFTSRRTLVSTLEIFDINQLVAKRYVCSVGGLGRIPD